MASMLIIEHPDGRRAAVSAAAFRKGADDEYKGFKAVAHEDGTPYEAPAKAPEQAQGAKKAGE